MSRVAGAALALMIALGALTSPHRASAQVGDSAIRSFFLVDQLEHSVNNGPDRLRFNGLGWVGGDYNRLWLNTEGTKIYSGTLEDFDVQVLYGRLIAPFWDLQGGVRYYQPKERAPSRGSAVFGIQGLAPQWFEVQAAAFVSNEGEVSGRLELEYELLLTQRLIVQPRLEANVAAQEVKKLGIGSSLNDLELGVRLRYEITREFAPYMGMSWTSKFGRTADFARRDGEDVRTLGFIVGVRLWF